MKKYLPIALTFAATVSIIGCMNVAPGTKMIDGALNADTTKSNLTNLSIRFVPESKSNYRTQAGGDYVTEIRLMYTEAIVRNDGTDYHFGLKGYAPTPILGTVGYALNEGTPSLYTASATPSHGLPIAAYYPTGPSADDPLFNKADSATASAQTADVATNSFLTGSYFLGAGVYKDNTTVADAALAPLDVMITGATGIATGTVTGYNDRLNSNMLRVRPAVDSVENVLKNIFKGTQFISYTTAAKTATTSVLIDPKIAATTVVTAPYIQALSKDLTAPDGTTIPKGAVYFKLTIPALVKEVKFPALPLGRLVVDVRKYSGKDVVSAYSFGQFLLKPAGNTLAVGDISGSITTETNPGITF